ncbi:hypothetical protein ACFX13_006844 [Malus domestica]
MSMPINNKEDLEAFMEAHRDVLGGCHLELERHNIDIRSKLALIIGSDPAKYLHSYVVFMFGAQVPYVWYHKKGGGALPTGTH